MAKKKTVFNPKSRDNLKILIKDTKLSQNKLAKKANISPITLSRILNSSPEKFQSMRLDTAQQIVDAVSRDDCHYRVEWLLGQDEYMTKEKHERVLRLDAILKQNREYQRKDSLIQKSFDGFCAMVELNGYNFLFDSSSDDKPIAVISNPEGQEKRIPYSKFVEYAERTSQFAEFLIFSLFKE